MPQTMRDADDDRNAARRECDVAISGSVVVTSDHQTLDGSAPERAADGVQEALQAFGVPRSKRGQRAHVVLTRPSRPSSGGAERRIENLAPDEWRPRHACSMSMDRALREMEFPSRLAGAEWVVGE
jgi:hypothetical protein